MGMFVRKIKGLLGENTFWTKLPKMGRKGGWTPNHPRPSPSPCAATGFCRTGPHSFARSLSFSQCLLRPVQHINRRFTGTLPGDLNIVMWPRSVLNSPQNPRHQGLNYFVLWNKCSVYLPLSQRDVVARAAARVKPTWIVMYLSDIQVFLVYRVNIFSPGNRWTVLPRWTTGLTGRQTNFPWYVVIFYRLRRSEHHHGFVRMDGEAADFLDEAGGVRHCVAGLRSKSQVLGS